MTPDVPASPAGPVRQDARCTRAPDFATTAPTAHHRAPWGRGSRHCKPVFIGRSPQRREPRVGPAATPHVAPVGCWWEIGGGLGCKVGERWVNVGHACRDPGGRAPPTQPPGFQLSARRMRTLDLPRHLRTRARREEPADGSGQVPRRPEGRSRARDLARDRARDRALARYLAARRLRRLRGAGAGGAQPA